MREFVKANFSIHAQEKETPDLALCKSGKFSEENNLNKIADYKYS